VLVNGPANGTLTFTPGDSAAGFDGSFTYSPNLGFTGTDTFTYQADHGHSQNEYLDPPTNINCIPSCKFQREVGPKNHLSNVAAVTINVKPVVAVNDSYSTNEDTPLVVPPAGVLANDSGAAGVNLSALVVANSAHGTVTLNLNGSFSYTPTANFSGPDSFTYNVNAGGIRAMSPRSPSW
jgi:hypothetical protein